MRDGGAASKTRGQGEGPDVAQIHASHEFHETCHSVTFYFMKKDFKDDVTPQHLSQFTPKMKANAVPRLLSSLV